MKIKGLNIVRTLGVVLVLLYHFFPMLLKGGFFGVDVFFVASGYLITALLIQDFRDGGGIRLLDFYKRRLLRLLPALILMLIAVIPFTLLISPDFRVGMYKQAVAAVAFFTNYYEISIGQSYENQLLPHLFVHTWSLAAEMQFYLFWGALASAALVLARRIKQGLEHGGSGFVLALAVILAVASYVRMQLGVDGDYDMSAAYYSAISHFFPFMIGSVAGIIFGFSLPGKIKELMRGKKLAFLSCILSIISVVGIAMLSAVLSFSDEATYRFGFLLFR